MKKNGIDASHTSYNIINNSLTAHNDASLNNIEISGKIKLPDSSNNGYGISGESLISQGPNNPPIWNPNYKVYGYAYLDGGSETHYITPNIIGKIKAFTIPVSIPNNLMVNGNGTNDGFRMIVRRAGYYRVEAVCTVGRGDTTPTGGSMFLFHNGNKVAHNQISDNVFTSNDSLYFFSLCVSGIFYADVDDYFYVTGDAGGHTVIMGEPGDGRRDTRFCIFNVD